MTFRVVWVRRADELDDALAAMMWERPDGLMVTGDAVHLLHVGRIINFLANNRLPGLFQQRENVVAGGLIIWSPRAVAVLRLITSSNLVGCAHGLSGNDSCAAEQA